MLGDEAAMAAYQRINDSYTVNEPAFYSGNSLVPDDHGTSHTSILAPNGDAVSVTSTINFRCVEDVGNRYSMFKMFASFLGLEADFSPLPPASYSMTKWMTFPSPT